MTRTKIEWTEHVLNPIVGCSVTSPGCANCYAMRMAARLERMGSPSYAGLTRPTNAGPVWTGETRLIESILVAPRLRKKPTTWFVNSMSDLFHESVPDAWIDRVFAVMALCPQHIFQLLTKRSARMRKYFNNDNNNAYKARVERVVDNNSGCPGLPIKWPLFNVWLGVSCEDQARADERIPDLLATPAAVRWVSAEPLLGPIDFTRIACPNGCRPPEYCNKCYPDGREATGSFDALDHDLNWVVVGGEIGPNARSMNTQWARDIRDQCADARVPFFFKQLSQAENPHGFKDLNQFPADLKIRQYPE